MLSFLRRHVQWLQYSATIASIAGAVLLAIPHWAAFVFFSYASIAWIFFASFHKHWGLLTQYIVFLTINLISLYRIWIGVWK